MRSATTGTRQQLATGRATKALISAGLALVVAASGMTARASAALADTQCQSVSPVVNVAGGSYHLAGTLCVPASANSTVELLLHGITYSHVYWDPAHPHEANSYVRAANAAGIATLNVDRIGIGASDHPPALNVTTQANVDMVHQLITQLRAGDIGSHAFQRVVLVGHSYGTVMSVLETSQYQDADALVLTGFMHTTDPVYIAYVTAQLVPTQTDPVLKPKGYPAGYLTTRYGQRGTLFYSPADTDPAMVTYDEQTKETVTDAEYATFVAFLDPLYSLNIHVPVFFGMGQHDGAFCNDLILLPCDSAADLVARERPFYANAPSFTGYVLPGSGHVMNNELNAQDWFAAAIAWEKQVLP
jgi:pimeloyl-ACP methyl ester carboxylesterase